MYGYICRMKRKHKPIEEVIKDGQKILKKHNKKSGKQAKTAFDKTLKKAIRPAQG